MRIRRFLVAGAPAPGRELALDPGESHHLQHVLRLGVGARIRVFDGRGKEFEAEVLRCGERVTVRVLAPAPAKAEPQLSPVLLVGLPRERAWAIVLQQCTELGVTRIIPLLAERSPRRSRRFPLERWGRILAAAAKQCGRATVPQLSAPVRLDEDPLVSLPAARLLLSPGGDGGLEWWPAVAEIAVAVGPEGGFTEREEELLCAAGFRRLHLGPRILRVETACAAGLVLVQHRYGDVAPLSSAAGTSSTTASPLSGAEGEGEPPTGPG